ncbi:hypothetical protein M406DRAFT_72338 [Cryphonectria parasitica EP155]|uniref:Peptidase S54 rhomboid domain-containing protein n=1 Tax=Cryphonectria parasitica (strain ATCC 38755 / EP155) TaxID=660469 RepID=A0A9P4XWQ1_CRYP1|nr:uncharacterized protein M406DRAFT_72338 [Cryphonectria parasitica EP155]KAF3762329.1 hypothetical protein M406DRAFT_72338 [Cryphonectria parasitica EP155]
MSAFLGFSCLRSGLTLERALRVEAAAAAAARIRSSPSTCLAPLSGSARFHSQWTVSSCHQPRNPLLLQVIQPQWRPDQTRRQVRHEPQKRTLFGLNNRTVLTHYVHLPPDYKDEEGLPFQREGDLDLPATVRIFPGFADMTPARATRLLRILHGRRVAGTVEDPSLQVNTAMYSAREISRALEYLRREVPVDEVLNAGLRAEDELRELEANMVPREAGDEEVSAEGGRTRKSNEAAEKDGNDDNPRSVYGESILDKIRARNIARREAEERAEAERQRKEDEAAAQNWGGLAAYDPSLHRGLHPKQLEHYEAATSDLEAPPEVPRWRILLPMTAFAGAVLAALYMLASLAELPQQQQPGQREVLGGSLTQAQAVAAAITLLNAAVFIAWRRVRLWKYLNRHFVLDFVSPRPYQLLTAMITHQDPRHLTKAMLLAWAGALLLVPELGPGAFLATYAASGVCGFLATLWTHVVRGQLIYMFGASSAGFGAICAYFWLYRFDGFKILGLPPDPYEGLQGLGIIGLIMAFFALVPLVRGQGGGVDWMSHLAGMVTGIGCASLMEGRWRVAKEEEEQQQKQKPVEEGQRAQETLGGASGKK